MYILVLLLIAYSSVAQAAERIAIHIGGGGEPNLFEDAFKNSNELFQNLGFTEVKSLYDGREASNIGADGEFNNAEVEKLLGSLESRKFNKGDQVFIVVDSHGSTELSNGVHCVVMSDGSCWSVSRLKKLRDHLNSQGVQVGIVDLSCHSGTTQLLANDQTCVISASNHDEPSINTQSKTFWNTLERSVNSGKMNSNWNNDMEGLYLGMRMSNRASSDLPMLSTPTGQKLNALEQEIYSVRQSMSDSYFGPNAKYNFGQYTKEGRLVGFDQFGFRKYYGDKPQCLANLYNNPIDQLGQFNTYLHGNNIMYNLPLAIRDYNQAISFVTSSMDLLEKAYGDISDQPPILYNRHTISPKKLLALPEHGASIRQNILEQIKSAKKSAVEVDPALSNANEVRDIYRKKAQFLEAELKAVDYFMSNQVEIRKAADSDGRTRSFFYYKDQLEDDLNTLEGTTKNVFESNNRAFISEYERRNSGRKNACNTFNF